MTLLEEVCHGKGGNMKFQKTYAIPSDSLFVPCCVSRGELSAMPAYLLPCSVP